MQDVEYCYDANGSGGHGRLYAHTLHVTNLETYTLSPGMPACLLGLSILRTEQV